MVETRASCTCHWTTVQYWRSSRPVATLRWDTYLKQKEYRWLGCVRFASQATCFCVISQRASWRRTSSRKCSRIKSSGFIFCMLGGLFEHGPKNGVCSEALVAEKTHEQSLRTVLFGAHRPGGPDDTLMPPGISLQFKGYGWHQDESKLILVCRERRMYRIPEDPKFSLRMKFRAVTELVGFMT